MILKPGEFQTLNGPIWSGHLGMARARRIAEAGRTALQFAACTNASCGIRHTCARAGRPSNVLSSWPGGSGCNGFQPATLNIPKVA